MDASNLFEFILNNNIQCTVVDDYKYEFTFNNKFFGFVSFEGKILTPYVKNIHPETGIWEFSPLNWLDNILQ